MTDSEKGLLENDSANLEEITGERTSLISKQSLLRRLRKGRESRARLVSSYIDKGIAYQIRAIRDRQELSQEELGEMVGMNQNAISRLESPWYGKATISTLKRLAAAFDVGLVIRFVPFGKLTNWITGTPYWEAGMSVESLAVPSFAEEIASTEAASQEKPRPESIYSGSNPGAQIPWGRQLLLKLMPHNVIQFDPCAKSFKQGSVGISAPQNQATGAGIGAIASGGSN